LAAALIAPLALGVLDWNVVIASLPYALGVTSVIFGKHIDKLEMDKAKGIHTLPVVLGERTSRIAVTAMMVLKPAVFPMSGRTTLWRPRSSTTACLACGSWLG
jgi:1,4-dihydroxy-2-naphthoate octaprenyltransferase